MGFDKENRAPMAAAPPYSQKKTMARAIRVPMKPVILRPRCFDRGVCYLPRLPIIRRTASIFIPSVEHHVPAVLQLLLPAACRPLFQDLLDGSIILLERRWIVENWSFP